MEPDARTMPVAFVDTTMTPAGITQFGARLVLARAPENQPAQLTEKGLLLVYLDFNRTTNPLRAFTPFWPAVPPPATNILPVAIKAGEIMPDLPPS